MARRSSPAPARAMAWRSSAWRSRGTTWVETSSAAQVEALEDAALEVRARRRVGPDRAGDRPDRGLGEGALEALGVAVGLEGEAGELDAERGRLGVDAVRAPDAGRVHVLARAGGEDLDEPAGGGDDELARAADLEGERGVEDVGRGQAEVDPAPALARRGREHVDEGGHVVIGDPLALLDRLDGEGGRADALEVGRRGAVHLLAGGHLDLAPGLHAGLVGPHGAQLWTCVAVDHFPGSYFVGET